MYASLYRDVLFPLYETKLCGRDTLRRLDGLEKSQWQSEDALKALSWRAMQDALKYAEAHIPFYRKRFADYGVRADRVQAPSDLAPFPILTKDDIRSAQHELISEQFSGHLHASATSGSTGEPIRFGYDHKTYEHRVAAALRADRWAGTDLGERELHLWAPPPRAALWNRLKRALHLALQRRKMLSTFDLDQRGLATALRAIESLRPRVIVGYTTALFHVARYALDRRATLPAPRGIIASAEQLFSHQRQTIERAFGAPVFDRYGGREVMLIAAECERHDGKHLNAENVFVEIVREDKPIGAGKTGEVLVSDLSNRSMPLLRYKNGDISSLATRGCGCGRGLALLESVQGRVLDMLVCPDGRLVAGEYFLHLLKDYPIDRFQVHQDRSRAFSIKIVPSRDFSAHTASVIQKELQTHLGDRAQITLEMVREIPLTAGGKHRVTVSEVPVDLNALP